MIHIFLAGNDVPFADPQPVRKKVGGSQAVSWFQLTFHNQPWFVLPGHKKIYLALIKISQVKKLCRYTTGILAVMTELQ